MRKVAVFVSHYGIGNSPSIVNMLDLLSDNFKVDLYLRDADLLEAPVLRKENINSIPVRRRHVVGYKVMNTILRFNSYAHYICFDPHGFVLCKEMFPYSRPIYYSLELYMANDHFGLFYPPETRRKEREWMNDIRGLIIQSDEKDAIFREDYKLSDEIPTFLLPVTQTGHSTREKSSYVRDKYRIDENKRIVLHLGEIKWWFACIEIARHFAALDNWAILFHGYYDEEYLEEMKRTLNSENIRNVIISDELYDSIDALGEIVQSCDVGLAWYSDISIGFRNCGRSSGKISAYLKFGLPVVVTKYPSTVETIEKAGCGVCVENYDEIGAALSKIEENYEEYSMAARAEYEKTYRFEKYGKELLTFLG